LRETTLYTDESSLYKWTGKRFASHETVTHSVNEYVRGSFIPTRLKASFRSSSAA
jgi:hypothetical protein